MISVKNGCPDFSHYAHGSVTVPGGFGVNRDANFKTFDEMLADQWANKGIPKEYQKWFEAKGLTRFDLDEYAIGEFRKGNQMVWHECVGGNTAQLLDRSLHNVRSGGIPHLGGISEIKSKQAQKEYNLINNQEKK